MSEATNKSKENKKISPIAQEKTEKIGIEREGSGKDRRFSVADKRSTESRSGTDSKSSGVDKKSSGSERKSSGAKRKSSVKSGTEIKSDDADNQSMHRGQPTSGVSVGKKSSSKLKQRTRSNDAADDGKSGTSSSINKSGQNTPTAPGLSNGVSLMTVASSDSKKVHHKMHDAPTDTLRQLGKMKERKSPLDKVRTFPLSSDDDYPRLSSFVNKLPSSNKFLTKHESDDRRSKGRASLCPMDISRVVPKAEVKRFMYECLVAVGVENNYALQTCEVLVDGDYFKTYATGLLNLEEYVHDIMHKKCNANNFPKILKENDCTAWINGNKALGPVIGTFCMQQAIKKASKTGIGIVVVNNSNYIGEPSFYSHRALKQGMIGITFTNSPPEMCPTRARSAALGANPLSIGVSAMNNDYFLFDTTSLVTSMGKLVMYSREMETLPNFWALDEFGKVTLDADTAVDANLLLPLGGVEDTGGYKGYGLGMMVEILCGILGDSLFGPNIPTADDLYCRVSRNLGHCFIVLNPALIVGSSIEQGMSDIMDYLRNLNSIHSAKPVLVPGDKERKNYKKVDHTGGIHYNQLNINAATLLATALKVRPLHVIEPE
ncbi:hypothetical protein C0J52_12122 [Blattella germanica]|nr:hypothetical protein C0J52_12122 [Blattella germanica]